MCGNWIGTRSWRRWRRSRGRGRKGCQRKRVANLGWELGLGSRWIQHKGYRGRAQKPQRRIHHRVSRGEQRERRVGKQGAVKNRHSEKPWGAAPSYWAT